jgi:hypothetical protein
MYQQRWGYRVEEKLYLGVREQKKVKHHCSIGRFGNWTSFRPQVKRRGHVLCRVHLKELTSVTAQPKSDLSCLDDGQSPEN